MGAPLSGVIVGEKVWEGLVKGSDMMGPIGHGWTYSAHPIGAAAGVANLELIDELGLVENAARVGAYLRARMAEALGDHPNVGEIRGEGMLCAVELTSDRGTRAGFTPVASVSGKVVAGMVKRGVIARAMPQGDIIGFAPPLCLSEGEADEIVRVTVEALREVLG